MNFIVKEANKAGQPKAIPTIDPIVQQLIEKWNEYLALKDSKSNWWEFWKTNKKANIFEVVSFMLNSLDQLILFVEELIEGGPDKKATVLEAMSLLYDYIVEDTLTGVFKWWSGTIKILVLSGISFVIDWIVGKYNEGWQDIRFQKKEINNLSKDGFPEGVIKEVKDVEKNFKFKREPKNKGNSITL